MYKDLNGSFWLSHGEWSAVGKHGGRDTEHETSAEAWSRWPQRRWAKEDRLKAILEVELIGNNGGAGMGMRPQRLSVGWPVRREWNAGGSLGIEGDEQPWASHFMVIY